MCASVGRQVSQARAIKEVSIVYGIHKVSKLPQARFTVHCYSRTGEAHTDVDDPLHGGEQFVKYMSTDAGRKFLLFVSHHCCTKSTWRQPSLRQVHPLTGTSLAPLQTLPIA